MLSKALRWRDISDTRRDISDTRALIQYSFRWIGSIPPAVLRLPSDVSPHKEQRLYKNLVSCNFANLILIPRLKKKIQVS